MKTGSLGISFDYQPLEIDYDPSPTPFGLVRDPRSQYNVGKYTEAEYNGISNVDSDPNTTLCIVGIGKTAVGGTKATKYGAARYSIDQYTGTGSEFVAFDRYIGAVMQGGKLSAMSRNSPRAWGYGGTACAVQGRDLHILQERPCAGV